MNKPTWTTGQLTQLRFQIATHFNSEEQRDLCFELGIDYDDLPAQTNSGKARELVMSLYRQERIPELIELSIKKRPKVTWQELTENEPTIEKIADVKARALKVFLKNMVDDGRIRTIATQESRWLIRFLAEKLSKEQVACVIQPALLRWRSGEINSVNSLKKIIELDGDTWLAWVAKNNDLLPIINKWLAGLSVEIEKLTTPICQEFDIPEKALHIRFHINIDDISLIDDGIYIDSLTGINDVFLGSFVLMVFGGGLAMAAKPAKPEIGITIMLVSMLGLTVFAKRLIHKLGEIKIPRFIRQRLTPENLDWKLFAIQTKLQQEYESLLRKKIDQDALIDHVVNRAEKELMAIVDTIKFA